jgi:hypothetical protein
MGAWMNRLCIGKKKNCIYIMPDHTLKKSLYIYLKSRLKMLIQWEYIYLNQQIKKKKTTTVE